MMLTAMGNDLESDILDSTHAESLDHIQQQDNEEINDSNSTKLSTTKTSLWMTYRQKVIASISIGALAFLAIVCPLLIPTVGSTAVIIAASIGATIGMTLLIFSFPHTKKEKTVHEALNNILSTVKKEEFLPALDSKVIKDIHKHPENFEVIDETATVNDIQIKEYKKPQLKALEEDFEAGNIENFDSIEFSAVDQLPAINDLSYYLTSSFGYYIDGKLERETIYSNNVETAFKSLKSFIKKIYPDDSTSEAQELERKRIRAFLAFLNLPSLQWETTAISSVVTKQKENDFHAERKDFLDKNYRKQKILFSREEKPSIIFNGDGSVSFYSALAAKIGKNLKITSTETGVVTHKDVYSDNFLPGVFLTVAKGTYEPNKTTTKTCEWITNKVIYPTKKHLNELFKNSKHETIGVK